MNWEDVEIGEPKDMRNSNEKESHQSKTSLMFISVKASGKATSILFTSLHQVWGRW